MNRTQLEHEAKWFLRDRGFDATDTLASAVAQFAMDYRYTCEEAEDRYDIGYSAGYDKGRDEGYSDGHDDGYNEGRDAGWDQGYAFAKAESSAEHD